MRCAKEMYESMKIFSGLTHVRVPKIIFVCVFGGSECLCVACRALCFHLYVFCVMWNRVCESFS